VDVGREDEVHDYAYSEAYYEVARAKVCLRLGLTGWHVVVEVEGLSLMLDEMYAGLKEYFETLGWELLTVQGGGSAGCKGQ